MEKMSDAKNALLAAAAEIPVELCARFESAAKLEDADRKTIIELARKSLAQFQPKPEAKAGPAPQAKP